MKYESLCCGRVKSKAFRSSSLLFPFSESEYGVEIELFVKSLVDCPPRSIFHNKKTFVKPSTFHEMNLVLKYLVIERRKPTRSRIHIKTVSVLAEEEDFIDNKLSLSRTEVKRLRRRVQNDMAHSVDSKQTIFPKYSPKPKRRGLLSLLQCFGSRKSTKDNESQKLATSPDTADTPPAIIETPKTEEKAKRFVSQARLMKKLMEERKEEIEESNSNSNSSFSEDEGQSRKELVDSIIRNRKMKRDSFKKSLIFRGGVDVVALNSGPPKELIPEGFKLSEEMPQLTPEYLLYKNVMYLWEGPHVKAKGWFLGIINGASRVRGCNFNIKYDRVETKNIYVDGVKNVSLDLCGENAYGRRWVIVVKQLKSDSAS